jgi:hypothetical protein
MLKSPVSMKELEHDAAAALRQILGEVPTIHDLTVELEPLDSGIDFIAHFDMGGRPRSMYCEVKSSGQPRYVRSAVHQLRLAIDQGDPSAVAVLVAPYLSEEARALCREHNVSFLDLQGNCRIALDTLFIERIVPTKPAVARRDLKSLFKPKSAQVLRVLLRAPGRAWKVVDLAEMAGVSLGHVSNVRTALQDREWAVAGPEGLQLSAPDALLDVWRDQYETPPGKRAGFYTTLHGKAFDKAVREALGSAGEARALLASFSAAQWIAPFARSPSHFLYADERGLDRLRHALQLSSASKGENVVITRLDDDGLFRDALEPAPGVFTTSPVQTYLDLAQSGERGREAADHLRREVLAWPG